MGSENNESNALPFKVYYIPCFHIIEQYLSPLWSFYHRRYPLASHICKIVQCTALEIIANGLRSDSLTYPANRAHQIIRPLFPSNRLMVMVRVFRTAKAIGAHPLTVSQRHVCHVSRAQLGQRRQLGQLPQLPRKLPGQGQGQSLWQRLGVQVVKHHPHGRRRQVAHRTGPPVYRWRQKAQNLAVRCELRRKRQNISVKYQ